MSASIFLEYSDLGHPNRGEGILSYYDVLEVARRKHLTRVYSRGVYKRTINDQVMAHAKMPVMGGNIIPRSLSAFAKYCIQGFPAVAIGEAIFDRAASVSLTQEDYSLLVTYPRMLRSLDVARRDNKVTVTRMVDLSPKYKSDALAAEEDRVRIKNTDPSMDTKLLRREGESAEKSDYLITFTTFQKSTFCKTGFPEDRIFVCPLGVDTQQYAPVGSTSSPRRVIFIGSPILRKGFHVLLEAWDRVDIPEKELLVCGHIGKETRQILRKYPHNRVKMLGRVPSLKPYLESAGAFVLPSFSEGLPKALLEAMASGLPPVVTEAAGSTVVRDGKEGFIVPVGGVDQLANKLQELLEDDARRMQMAMASRARAESLTWDRYSGQMADIVDGLLERGTFRHDQN